MWTLKPKHVKASLDFLLIKSFLVSVSKPFIVGAPSNAVTTEKFVMWKSPAFQSQETVISVASDCLSKQKFYIAKQF